jgi:hypothetical protein
MGKSAEAGIVLSPGGLFWEGVKHNLGIEVEIRKMRKMLFQSPERVFSSWPGGCGNSNTESDLLLWFRGMAQGDLCVAW